MITPQLLYYASDKDLFDALISSRQQFSEAALRQLARRRGIFYSEQENRVDLCDHISLLNFGYQEVSEVQAEFERAGRGEKTTSFRIKTALTLEEIKQITGDYVKEASGSGERLSSHLVGSSGFSLDLRYREMDFSKTALKQVQSKEAKVEVKVVGDETIVTYGSSAKAESMALAISKRVNAVRTAVVELESVDLSSFIAPSAKTEFFYKLVTSMEDFKMLDVTNVKVDSHGGVLSPPLTEDPKEEDHQAEEVMLGVVRAVALHGESLLSSPEYQSLQRRGFFISKIQWSAKRQTTPYPVVEFDASFSDPVVGTGFKYAVRGWSTQRNGDYTKGFNAIPPDDKKALLELLEASAMKVFKALKAADLLARQNTGIPEVGAAE